MRVLGYAYRPIVIIITMVLLASMSLVPTVSLAYHDDGESHDFASGHFQDRWERIDLPVATDLVDRTWMWGPEPYTGGMMEEYADSPNGQRLVQYFDKSRMEITYPDADDDGLWYVTNGLLVVEMIEGRIQTGDDDWDESPDPAEQQIAGDPDSPFGLTYADINRFGLRNATPYSIGATISQTVVDGQVETDDAFAQYGVTAAHRVQVPGIDHTVALVFWDFMNSTGVVNEGEQYVTDRLFVNPFYATGYPITEAYWANVLVADVQQDVLWQCFERRCLTYTPGNEPGFQVEAGNVGQHYYRWRYGDEQPQTEAVNIFLVALEDAGQSGIEFGCGDSAVPVEVEIEPQENVEGRIAAALNRMFAIDEREYGESGLYNVFHQSNLTVGEVTLIEGTATIQISGQLSIGGVCDEPRVEEQIRQTALQFDGVDEVVILLNGGPPFEPQAPLSGGVLATFDVNGEQFRVWVTNEDTIEQIFALRDGESAANIPNGVILRGPGEGDHNQPWSWHLDPEQIEMAEVTIEVCDGAPSFVEANVDYFVDEVGRYCPWNAQLVEVRDYRDQNGNGNGNGSETETVEVYLYAPGDAGEHGTEFGCDDTAVPVEVEIDQHDALEDRIAAALRELFETPSGTYNGLELNNVFEDSGVSLLSVKVTEGLATVNISGGTLVGGVCDEPRVPAQIRYTVLQFDGVNEVVVLRDGGPVFEPQPGPESGIVAIFQVNDEQFRVWVTNEQTIDDILAVEAGESQATIPNGRVLQGSGEANHNEPWSWHLDPEDIDMVEAAAGACNAVPSFVEANRDTFVDTINRYCPWSAELVEVRDYRE